LWARFALAISTWMTNLIWSSLFLAANTLFISGWQF
jgi:hypothetical protein